MTEEEMKRITDFFNQVIKLSKNGSELRVESRYVIPAEKSDLWGWLLTAVFRNKRGTLKEVTILFEEN